MVRNIRYQRNEGQPPWMSHAIVHADYQDESLQMDLGLPLLLSASASPGRFVVLGANEHKQTQVGNSGTINKHHRRRTHSSRLDVQWCFHFG